MEFREYLSDYTHMDDFGDEITEKRRGYRQYIGGDNVNLICESSLSRLIRLFERKSFAVITAYRDEMSKQEKIAKNRQLRGILNSKKMGVHQLVGHWRECQLKGVEYKDCPKDQLVDVIERSYFVPKPDSMDFETFEKIIASLVKEFNQDGAIIGDEKGIYIIEGNGSKFKIGSKLELGKISQAYSQHIKKMNVPFVFEGLEQPASITGRMIMKKHGIRWM